LPAPDDPKNPKTDRDRNAQSNGHIDGKSREQASVHTVTDPLTEAVSDQPDEDNHHNKQASTDRPNDRFVEPTQPANNESAKENEDQVNA
jgi:hypothetical protein